MARLAELFVMVNAIAGIAAFFGGRAVARKLIRRKRPTPTSVVKR